MTTASRVRVPLETLSKDPDAKLIYGLDLGVKDNDPGWLNGDTIASVTWSVWCEDEASSTLTIVASNPGVGGSVTTVQLEGGTPGLTYHVTCHVTKTNTGEFDDRTFVLKIEER